MLLFNSNRSFFACLLLESIRHVYLLVCTCLSTILYFHDGSAVLQSHETPHSHAAPVFGLALRLGHEQEAEWSLKRRMRVCVGGGRVCVCVCKCV